MKSDYKINGPTEKVQFEIEKGVLEIITEMEKYAKISSSEIINTALKRYISQHKDFLPPGYVPLSKT